MKQKRFFVGYSNTANAYVIYDRYDKVPENSNGYAILWETFNTCKSEVTKECNELNEEFERTGHVKHLGI